MPENKKYYGYAELKALCEKLAPSQGFYGRLLESIEGADDTEKKRIDRVLRDAKITDDVGLILALEA